jgi:hypothetical protein
MLRLDLANPYLGGSGRGWWAGFAGLLPECGLRLAEAGAVPFDRLGSSVVAGRAPRDVSVVVTAYRPDRGLVTAVRSVLGQSWGPAEVLVVDDASPGGFDGVLRECAELDPRVQVVRLPVNAGTYRARNVGIGLAAGEFVTFQDSDDWSHPRRIERQLPLLLDDPEALAVTSAGVEVTELLRLTRPGYPRVARLNPSSLLLRRAAVRERLGGFDEVRKGADSELIDRMVAAYGPQAVRHVPESLALIRLSADSLSRGEVRAAWLHPARAAYASAYRAWHARIAAGEAAPFLGERRPFAAPGHMTGRSGPRDVEVLVLTDWTVADGVRRGALDQVVALAAAGVRVGVAHLPSFRRVSRRRRAWWRDVQELVNDGTVEQVTTAERATAGLLLVPDPQVLQFADRPGWVDARHTVLLPGGPHDPGDCTAVARALGGAEPQWSDDWPQVIEPARWRVERAAGLPERPVVGLDLTGPPGAALVAALRGYDVRVRTGDPRGLPVGWLAYDFEDVPGREFVAQIDVYLSGDGERETLEALAAGCVVVRRPGCARTRGNVTVTAGWGEWAAVDASVQRREAARVVARHRAADLVARVRALLGTGAAPAPAQRVGG